MARIIVLDSGPLGLLVQKGMIPRSMLCRAWLDRICDAGSIVVIPEIADYELRRELQRLGKRKGLARLDALLHEFTYAPITTAAMRRAALLWAKARQSGRPTADPHALDGDVILAAQAELLVEDPSAVVIATTNLAHLSLFPIRAQIWTEIDGG